MINILGTNYRIIDVLEDVNIADSFVLRHNKIGSGSGEAKLYIGNENSDLFRFWGPLTEPINCFLLKNDLILFLNRTRREYINPLQSYMNSNQRNILFTELTSSISDLRTDKLDFKSYRVDVNPPRVYLKSDSPNYKLIRSLGLPNLTSLSIMKLEDSHGNISFYFRLFEKNFSSSVLDYSIDDSLATITEPSVVNTIRRTLTNIRIGQNSFRNRLLEECTFCPFTNVNDPKLLIASHIKPWVASDDQEKLDPKNGFIFTPTYDTLFDKGLISFNDDKTLLISNWLSEENKRFLNISENMIINHLPLDEHRCSYLKYHRDFIFRN